ncbi:MAG: serine/threonine protein kinase [Actinobacteria bacterium]|nr:serine/threonine protein kinase [Actinomycetota bacterium]
MHVKTDNLLLNRYKILSKLGSGGFSDVYKALDTRMERVVAIKQIHVSRHSAPRALREAQTVALLNHPNIVTLHEFEEDGDECYLIMELIEGVPLSKILAKLAPLSTEEAITVATQICRALEAAHLNGVIHRDVKPENVMILHDGRLKVMDFGIAMLKGTAIATSGDIIGTFAYMSPEQARGEPVDERSDIFSLGTVFYEMITGFIPFNGGTAAETLNMVQNVGPDLPSKINPVIPEEIGRCVMRALEKNPQSRYASAADFRTTLESCRSSAKPIEEILSNLINRYISIDEGLGSRKGAGWRGHLWLFLDEHYESITRTTVALLLSLPFLPILKTWFSLPRSIAVFGTAMIFIMVLLQPNYGIGITFFLFLLATIKHSPGLSLILLFFLLPYWALISRRWPSLSVWPIAGALFGLLRIPFVFPILIGLLADPIAAALISGMGCVAFELLNIFLKESTSPELIQGYGLWSLIKDQSNPIFVAQLISGPFLEDRTLFFQPILWSLVAVTTSIVKGNRRWFTAAIAGFIVLTIGYQGLFVVNFNRQEFDMGELMQSLSFSLIILLLLPIFRPPPEDASTGSDLAIDKLTE